MLASRSSAARPTRAESPRISLVQAGSLRCGGAPSTWSAWLGSRHQFVRCAGVLLRAARFTYRARAHQSHLRDARRQARGRRARASLRARPRQADRRGPRSGNRSRLCHSASVASAQERLAFAPHSQRALGFFDPQKTEPPRLATERRWFVFQQTLAGPLPKCQRIVATSTRGARWRRRLFNCGGCRRGWNERGGNVRLDG